MAGSAGVRRVTVTAEESGQKLIKFLERRLGRDVPGGRIMRAVRKGEVRVDGRRAKPFDRVVQGQEVRIPPIRVSDPEPPKSPSSDNEPNVVLLHKDGELLVVDKPSGLAVHGGSGHDDSVVSRLRTMFPDDPFAPTPVHRLDRDTTGVLLVARSYEALVRLQRAFKDRMVRKFYLAWVVGNWESGEPVLLEDRLAKGRDGTGERVRATRDGAVARAEARLIERRGKFSLVRVELFTGRTHQIRAQLALRGHPVAGDAKYGGAVREAGGLYLHCLRIEAEGRAWQSVPGWKGPWAVNERIIRA